MIFSRKGLRKEDWPRRKQHQSTKSEKHPHPLPNLDVRSRESLNSALSSPRAHRRDSQAFGWPPALSATSAQRGGRRATGQAQALSPHGQHFCGGTPLPSKVPRGPRCSGSWGRGASGNTHPDGDGALGEHDQGPQGQGKWAAGGVTPTGAW